MFKQLATFLLLVAFVFQSFENGLVVVDYYLNTAVFAKNCENKAKPALHCNGKCQMMKKMQETEKRDQQLPERKSENKIEIFYCNTKYHNFENIFSEISPSQVVTEENNLLKDISLSLFRPPQRA